MTETARTEHSARGFDVVLVLSGGNALGAFQAGVYEALHTHDLQPDWVVGASVGAINAALIAGSAPEDRVDALRFFWKPHVVGLMDLAHPWLSPGLETSRRSAAAAWTAIAGRAGIFGPVLSASTPWPDHRPSVFETEQLGASLDSAIDFKRLNEGSCRFTATAVDLETGDDVIFDTQTHVIGSHHVRASAALPVLFPPVEIDGRYLVDGGLSANLPLDPVLSDPPARPTLCIAIDLLPLVGRLPTTLGEAAGRMQDLVFAAQSRRSITRWQERFNGRVERGVALMRLAYTQQEDEVAGKALDFSGPTVERRWAAGYAAGMRVVEKQRQGGLAIGTVGLTLL
ncbi:patatin-like phospholipase family protein [Sphingomonas melonis]|uniref:NTE family protein n=1 Tax=Sphingomonas melonis TaxID=152682 RepID=A0A7Y9FMW2_9SPHN|nr:patatin-like phospholipase family protein [Sphingomonas melonis]NYD89041.1 NTE family protein [Sphingomonas melonis]